jgi:type I restriction enzyme S subunit
MERYAKYKDSGIAWLGDIPEHWKVIKLKYIGESIIGMTYSPDDVVPSKGTLVLRSSNIQDGKLSLDDCVFIQKDIPDKLRVKKGDILICSRNGSRSLIGKNITINETTEGQTFGAFMTIFRTKLSEFVSKYFNSQVFNGQSGLFLTATINQLTINTINNFFIALPSLEEQKTIAAYLDRKTAEIDELIAQKERLIALYEEEKTAIINEAVTKGINPDVKLKPTAIDWLGDIPEHWKVKKLKYITPNITVGIVITPAKYYVDSGVACLRSLNVKENYLDNSNLVFISPESNELLEKSKIHKDDLVAVRTGKPGTTAIVNEEFDGTNCIDLIIIRKSNQILSIFLSLQLNSSFTKFQFSTGTDGAIQQHFNIETACNIIVLLPPLEEQKAIAEYIEKETARIDAKIAKTKRIIELQKEYRTALISEAVTGKIKIPDLTELDQ